MAGRALPNSVNSAMSSICARTSVSFSPIASPPTTMLRCPESSGFSAAFTPSRVGWARTRIEPLVAGTRPAIADSSVDFPEPLEPTIPTISPSEMVLDTPLTAWTTVDSRPLKRCETNRRMVSRESA